MSRGNIIFDLKRTDTSGTGQVDSLTSPETNNKTKVALAIAAETEVACGQTVVADSAALAMERGEKGNACSRVHQKVSLQLYGYTQFQFAK